jgi:hypothetical protein
MIPQKRFLADARFCPAHRRCCRHGTAAEQHRTCHHGQQRSHDALPKRHQCSMPLSIPMWRAGATAGFAMPLLSCRWVIRWAHKAQVKIVKRLLPWGAIVQGLNGAFGAVKAISDLGCPELLHQWMDGNKKDGNKKDGNKKDGNKEDGRAAQGKRNPQLQPGWVQKFLRRANVSGAPEVFVHQRWS